MVQMGFEENMNSGKVRQPLDDATRINRSGESGGTRTTIERINKMKKILALVDSPCEGEALAAARTAVKLMHAWGIDLQSLRFSSGDLVNNFLEKVAKSGPENFSWSHIVPRDHVRECSDSETRPRTVPVFVKAHLRRRHGGPPFPVRPHRRRLRTRSSSSAQAYPK